jgi:hypothetical protein
LFCGVEQDVQVSAFVVGFVVGEILLDVFEGFGQQVQAVPELVELVAGHDELVFAETQLRGPLTGFVVALAAGAFAVLARPSGAGVGLEGATAPSALIRYLRTFR